MTQRSMDRAALQGVELTYEVRGAGEPVVLIHPGHFAEWFAPVFDEPALTNHYRVLTYHRVGCAGSSPIAGPVSFAQQADHCRSLMWHLVIERGHIVGLFFFVNRRLPISIVIPYTAHSLALLEP